MKKLSKILVVVLTLAMLLGAIVISASAAGKKVDVVGPNGEELLSTDSFEEAIAYANGYAESGDVTIKLNDNVTMTKAITITRDADLGKVIVDLDGKTLTVKDVINTYTALATVINGSKGSGRIVDYVWVKATAEQATAVPYFLDTISFDGDIYDEDGNKVEIPEGKTAAKVLIPGETYIGTLTAVVKDSKVNVNHKLPTLTYKRGVFNVGKDASLEVAGNGGTITRGNNAHVFYIGEDADGAELYVRDLQIPDNATAYAVYVNNGVSTFDNVYMYSKGAPGIIRHANSAELNIKNSYLYMPSPGGANGAAIRTQGTNFAEDNPADGYHIEVTNTTIITAAYAFASANTDVSACATTYEHVQPDQSSNTRKTFYASYEVPLVGNDYVNTNFLVENCNIEIVNYINEKADNDRTALIGNSGFMNFDFKKCNLLTSQRGIAYGLTASPDACYINMYDCYFELTGKGNLTFNNVTPNFVTAANGLEVNFYRTEFAVGKVYADKGNTNSKYTGNDLTAADYFANSAKISFHAGCIFDSECALNSDLLKRVVDGSKPLTKTDKNGVVTSMILTGWDYTTTDAFGYITYRKEVDASDLDIKTSSACNPIVVLSNGITLTESGADTTARQAYGGIVTGKSWSMVTSQGIEGVAVDADGNKYTYYDPSYVKNDMTGYSTNYVAKADFAEGVVLPTGVTAVGGWDIDKDGVLEYLDTDSNNADAEYANIAKNGAGYKWAVIPDKYTEQYVSSSTPWYTIGSKYFYAPDYSVVTYSFDYKNAEGSDYFLPLVFAVQARAEFAGRKNTDSGNRAFELSEDGKVYINNVDSGKVLEKDVWNNITLVVELKSRGLSEEEKAKGEVGIMTNDNTWSDITYNPSRIYVFINGVKAGEFKSSGFYNEHGYVATLRGNLGNGLYQQSDINKAIAGGAKMCIDNVIDMGYNYKNEAGKDVLPEDLRAVLDGSNSNLDDWEDCILTLHKYNEVKDFPEEKTPAASITITPPVATSTWNNVTDKTIQYDEKQATDKDGNPAVDSSGNPKMEGIVRASTFKYADVNEAIAMAGGWASKTAVLKLDLLADAEKVYVDSPVTINTNDKEITYYSNAYKGTLKDGILTFSRATAADLIEITYDYADGNGPVTETVIVGGYFWLDADRIPTVVEEELNLNTGRIMHLAYNGKLLDTINPADYVQQVITAENKSFIFTYEVAKQYGWVILDVKGITTDAGDEYSQLVDRIEAIERLYFDPFANDNDEGKKGLTDIVNGAINPELYKRDDNTESLRKEGYTIKFFKDFENVETINFISSTQAKTVNYDLNGHTITYKDFGIHAFGAKIAWVYEKATNNVVKVAGSTWTGVIPTYNSNTTYSGYNENTHAYIVLQSNFTLNVNIFSSVPGAKMISTSKNALVSSNRQEHLKFNGTNIKSGYTSPTITFGNAVAASHTDYGPDANVIDVEAKLVFNVYQFNSGPDNIVQNFNIVSDSDSGVIVCTNDRTVVKNCNITYTNKDGKGVFGTHDKVCTGTIKFEVTKCNIVSLYKTNLFNFIGGRYDKSAGSYVSVSNTRMYNVAIDANGGPYWSSNANYDDDYDEVITIGAGCYYNVPFNPTKTYSIKSDGSKVNVVPFRLAASRLKTAEQYKANVYANETFTINGVDYTFTYKVAADADVVSVQWQDTNGVALREAENYVKGGKLVFGESATRVDAITKAKYVFGIDTVPTDYAEKTLVVKATEYRYFPAFSVKHNINLETNIKHNIKIWKYVLYGEEYVDITNYITSVTVGGQNFVLKAENLNKGADADNPYDDYYYYTVDVKSNAIASEYNLVINFKTVDGSENVVATQKLSVANYLSGELAKAEKDSDLYNVCAAIVNYGIASYANFATTADGDVNKLKALAEKYPVADVVIGAAEAGVAAGKIDVEFVLDEQLEYRFKFIDEAMRNNWEYLTVEISYTDINGEVKTLTTNKTLEKYEGYFVDFVVDACEFAGDVTVRAYLIDSGNVTNECIVTYNIANYYADALAVDAPSTLLNLVEALNAYATYAKAYIKNK